VLTDYSNNDTIDVEIMHDNTSGGTKELYARPGKFLGIDGPEEDKRILERMNKQTTIYLSGPMSGLPDYNSAEFAKYAEIYRQQGFRVLSPPELDAGDWSKDYAFYIKRDIEVLVKEHVSRIYLLPGWQDSRGARLEHHIAELLGIGIYDAVTGKPYKETVAQEANRIVNGDRRGNYGSPLKDFGRTSGMLNALLAHKLREKLSEEDVSLIMICVKLSRLANSPDHRDSLVDICGYALTYELVQSERKDYSGTVVSGSSTK